MVAMALLMADEVPGLGFSVNLVWVQEMPSTLV